MGITSGRAAAHGAGGAADDEADQGRLAGQARTDHRSPDGGGAGAGRGAGRRGACAAREGRRTAGGRSMHDGRPGDRDGTFQRGGPARLGSRGHGEPVGVRRGEGGPTARRQGGRRGWAGTNPGPVGRGGKHVPDTVTTTARLPHRTVWEPLRVGGTSGLLVYARSCP